MGSGKGKRKRLIVMMMMATVMGNEWIDVGGVNGVEV